MKFFLLPLILILGFVACKNETKENISKSQELFKEIMVIHDDVMPMMSEVHRQKRALIKIMKDSTNTISREILNKMIKSLDTSDEEMMDWMAEFDSNKQNDNSPEATSYLITNKKIISEISQHIKTSISKAKKLTSNEK